MGPSSCMLWQNILSFEVGDEKGTVCGTPNDVPRGPFLSWSFRGLTFFVNPTRDENWLRLTQHYFAQLKWPQSEPQNETGVSLMELMLDLLIAFQVRIPVNISANHIRLPGFRSFRPSPQHVMYCRLAHKGSHSHLTSLQTLFTRSYEPSTSCMPVSICAPMTGKTFGRCPCGLHQCCAISARHANAASWA